MLRFIRDVRREWGYSVLRWNGYRWKQVAILRRSSNGCIRAMAMVEHRLHCIYFGESLTGAHAALAQVRQGGEVC